MFCPYCGSENVIEVEDDDTTWELHALAALMTRSEYYNNMIRHKCEDCGREFFISDI